MAAAITMTARAIKAVALRRRGAAASAGSVPVTSGSNRYMMVLLLLHCFRRRELARAEQGAWHAGPASAN